MPLPCSTCGAIADASNPYATAEIDSCSQCGAALPMSPEAVTDGKLVLGSSADLRVTLDDGPPQRLDVWGRGGRKVNQWVAWQGPARSDVDVRLSLRFEQGTPSKIAAGVTIRDSIVGSYGFRIDANGSFHLCHWSGPKFDGEIVPWQATDALRKGLGVNNQLRLQMRGNHIRGWLNDILVLSIYDNRCSAGLARVILEPDELDAHMVVTQFLVRDAED